MTVAEVRPGESGQPRDLDPEALATVEAILRDTVGAHAGTLEEAGAELAGLVDVLREAACGGKRLRASFCLWGARAGAGGAVVDGALEAAAALELFHLAALVHDDVMDHSDERRGRPTIHRRFADEHRAAGALGDADEHGAAVAILAGDLCLTWADDLVADAVASAPRAAGRQARRVWTRMRDQVLAGQYLDLLGATTTRVESGQVDRVLRYKSASYTVEHPLALGAALTGAPEHLTDRLARFGRGVGEAFQLRDDVLGVFGDPAVTGKPAGDDVREGKRTLLVAAALARGDRTQRAQLRRVLGDADADEAQLALVRDVMVATGALDHVEQRIADLVDAATTDLAGLRLDRRTERALAALTDACAWRVA